PEPSAKLLAASAVHQQALSSTQRRTRRTPPLEPPPQNRGRVPRLDDRPEAIVPSCLRPYGPGRSYQVPWKSPWRLHRYRRSIARHGKCLSSDENWELRIDELIDQFVNSQFPILIRGDRV